MKLFEKIVTLSTKIWYNLQVDGIYRRDFMDIESLEYTCILEVFQAWTAASLKRVSSLVS